VSQKTRSTFVVTDPSEIVQALVGLKDVCVLHYERRGPDVDLIVEQVVGVVPCPSCGERAQVKERPVVHYVDQPVYGTLMHLGWKKHRMRCVTVGCRIEVHTTYFNKVRCTKRSTPKPRMMRQRPK
jgi:transposase